jgi:hypothetical protein
VQHGILIGGVGGLDPTEQLAEKTSSRGLPHEHAARSTLHELGFGMAAMDALRLLEGCLGARWGVRRSPGWRCGSRAEKPFIDLLEGIGERGDREDGGRGTGRPWRNHQPHDIAQPDPLGQTKGARQELPERVL